MFSRQTDPDRLPARSWALAALVAAVCGLSSSSLRADGIREAKRYAGLTLEEWDVRIKAFSYSSPEASRSVPGLIEIVEDRAAPWESRRQAALTLGRMGKPAAAALPSLVRLAARHPEETEETRLWALTALARFGPVAAEAEPLAADVLQNSEEPHLLRLAATEVLGRIGGTHPRALEPLLQALRRPDRDQTDVSRESDLRVACTDAVSLFGGAAAGAVPILMRQLSHPAERVRQSTLTTLAAIGPRADVAAMRVAEILLRDPVPLTQDRAAEALVQMRVDPLLVRLLEAPAPSVRERIATALIRARPPITPELARAVRACVDEDPELTVRGAALRADWAWTRDARSLAPVAAFLLGSASRPARKAGYEVLNAMGPDAAGVRPELERLASGAEPQAAAAARNLLDRLRRSESAHPEGPTP